MLSFSAAPTYLARGIELSYFSIADGLSADIDVAGVVSRTKPSNRSPSVPCRPPVCRKCPVAADPPARLSRSSLSAAVNGAGVAGTPEI